MHDANVLTFNADEPMYIEMIGGPCDGAYCVFVGPLPTAQLRGIPVIDPRTAETYIGSASWYHLRMRCGTTGDLLESIDDIVAVDGKVDIFYVVDFLL